ncbi:IS66 family insertion sequence element accessory protein TnpB [Neoroseomonas soli]|uniref:IS66 family insertion sequence element accessory protein TnpB n=1 Tax=Neoroseomonas soli TaxID=1081025 RepID=A0A9X9X346_9PROT|nr:IS66 family insertion sequence element accessory protein TnpB [Neoroseomonas soli]
MIAPAAGAQILLATKPVDFRKGAHSLAALAAEVLGADPFSGAVLVFRSRRADRIKILLWDGSGLVLIWKQLEGGAFRWPPVVDGVLRLTPRSRASSSASACASPGLPAASPTAPSSASPCLRARSSAR